MKRAAFSGMQPRATWVGMPVADTSRDVNAEVQGSVEHQEERCPPCHQNTDNHEKGLYHRQPPSK